MQHRWVDVKYSVILLTLFYVGSSWSAKRSFNEPFGDRSRCGRLPSEEKSISVSYTYRALSLVFPFPSISDYLNPFKLFFSSRRSPDLLQPEEPFVLSERHSSSDSNKASSGEVSPYDNNSPVLSERRGEPGSPASEQLYRVPEQYSLVGQSGAVTWGYKGERCTMSGIYRDRWLARVITLWPFFLGISNMSHNKCSV